MYPRSARLPSRVFLQLLPSCNWFLRVTVVWVSFPLGKSVFLPFSAHNSGEEEPRTCMSVTNHRGQENRVFQERLGQERDSREHEEPTTSEMAEETYSPKIFRPKHTRISELKAEAVKKDRRKKLTQSKFVGGAEDTAHPRVISAPEMRQESEQGPCRRHMEASLQELKASPRMVPRAVYLPNCDRKGFYKRKQCKPSRGRKRGICWCVDKYGMKLPGMEYVDGDFQCHTFDSSNGRKYIYLSI
ncbi:insulin-like growth factor-binding protein 5 isoform X3 [Monodon monoceros]|uniref:insulin-like growth factor-binding protein 5 isoform X3 n=1 Tax=Monodon monoceros TaxID=40151 RepID=UPI0010F5CFA7|nr:insulin-like growth factor-binding protein 5 isoform X3 [Monodon monoceros]